MMTIPPELQELSRKLEFERMLKDALMEHLKVQTSILLLHDNEGAIYGTEVTTTIRWDDEQISLSTSRSY
jgi:hypothetical protein